MPPSSHLDKLEAAIRNPKCERDDVRLLEDARERYQSWKASLAALRSKGRKRIAEMTRLLNEYKDFLEVELIARRGSAFLKRQKGQLKLDNSVLEEFLVELVQPGILDGLPEFPLTIGPTTAFMSLSFAPPALRALNDAPIVALKVKDQDFIIGTEIHYRFSPDPDFTPGKTASGSLSLAVLAAECKVNLDKTMFQEAAGTAARLKQGCPYSQYYILNEYLDMEAEDCRLTAIDNVFLLRHAKRLPFEKRSVHEEIRRQHEQSPIDAEVVWLFVEKIQAFISAAWYDPGKAIQRGSFV
ncbi:MAG: Bpu10I family restriction endonuclease [Verrucomicrobia bacterium]|nr:Bpu10I family restriction endonuclease [Verrucomicrobiota bacterium]